MSDEVKITIDGLPELQAKLLALGQDLGAASIVSSAYTANLKMQNAIKAKIVANNSVRTGLLRDSITRKKVIFAGTGTVNIIVGVNRNTRGTFMDKHGKVHYVRPSKYAHLVNKAKPFLDPAVENTSQEVVDAFVTSLERKIDKYTT